MHASNPVLLPTNPHLEPNPLPYLCAVLYSDSIETEPVANDEETDEQLEASEPSSYSDEDVQPDGEVYRPTTDPSPAPTNAAQSFNELGSTPESLCGHSEASRYCPSESDVFTESTGTTKAQPAGQPFKAAASESKAQNPKLKYKLHPTINGEWGFK